LHRLAEAVYACRRVIYPHCAQRAGPSEMASAYGLGDPGHPTVTLLFRHGQHTFCARITLRAIATFGCRALMPFAFRHLVDNHQQLFYTERYAKRTRECRLFGPARAIGAGERPAARTGSLHDANFWIEHTGLRAREWQTEAVALVAVYGIAAVATPAGVSGAVLLLRFQVSVLGTASPQATRPTCSTNVVAPRHAVPVLAA
jgi:hypothetical protein